MNSPNIPGGLLVAIEGIDGAGKTTVATALRRMFEVRGFDAVVSKEPTAGPWGQKLRETAFTERLSPERECELLLQDRRQHVKELIAPTLAAGGVVILDRYFPSMVAYQGAEGLAPSELLAANDFAPRPDVLLLLDLAPSEGLRRIRERGDRPNTFETSENLERCRAIFLALGLDRTELIDATQPLETVIGQAERAVLKAIAGKLDLELGPVEAVKRLTGFLPDLNPEAASA